MCGIFGMVRNTEAAHFERASAALIELGRHSMERGRDSSGLALIPRPDSVNDGTVYKVSADQMKSRHADLDGVVVIKDTLPFDEFWKDDEYLSALTAATAVIGHTRWATQGSKSKLENASPLAVDYLVGTHNGDVDISSVADHWNIRKDVVGGTDTEYLYRAISAKRSHRKKITDILRDVNGRAALAWIERTVTDRLFLARAALSPLAIAFDAEGNFYWASNPEWFRKIDEKFNHTIGFHSISMVQEGTLLTVTFGKGKADVEDFRSFTPKARYSDDMMHDGIVWRGFVDADREADQKELSHLTAPAPVKTYSSDWKRSGTNVGTASTGGFYSKGTTDAKFSSAEVYNPAAGTYTHTDELSEDIYEMSAYKIPDEYEDEIADAVITWAEQGKQPLVVTAVRDAVTDADFKRIAKDYALSDVKAARLFKREVLLWDTYDGESPAEYAQQDDTLDQKVALADAGVSC